MSKCPTIYTVVEIVQTSSIWPNQYEGRFSDGDYLYIRAKDSFSISKSPTEDGMGRDEFDIITCEMPDELKAPCEMTIPMLIAFCKSQGFPIKFEIAKELGE